MLHEWTRRAAGLLRAAGWMVTLWYLHAPWRQLGGLVSERTRWAERCTLGMGLIAGMAAGNQARLASRPGTGYDHAWFVRRLHVPVAAAVAAAVGILQWSGRGEIVLIVVIGWLAFCAGFDAEIAARPLVEGRDYRFHGPVKDPEDEVEDDPLRWFSG